MYPDESDLIEKLENDIELIEYYEPLINYENTGIDRKKLRKKIKKIKKRLEKKDYSKIFIGGFDD